MASSTPANTRTRPLAIVTGASSGIGYQLALLAAQEGFDLVAAADTSLDDLVSAAQALGADVTAVQADLATGQGVDSVCNALAERTPAVLMANAGHGLGRGEGRIPIPGSIAVFMPGSFQAVYDGTKAFIDSFSIALRNEIKDTGVTVTCLMPGVTDTEFFERADLMDTGVGTQEGKAHPAEVAKIGFDAMVKGEADVVAGFKNKLQVAMAGITPKEVLAEQHRKMAQPGTAKN